MNKYPPRKPILFVTFSFICLLAFSFFSSFLQNQQIRAIDILSDVRKPRNSSNKKDNKNGKISENNFVKNGSAIRDFRSYNGLVSYEPPKYNSTLLI